MLVWPRCAVLCSIKPIGASTVVYRQRLIHVFFLSATMLLSSCGLLPADTASGGGESDVSDLSAAGELDAGICQCPGESQLDHFTLGLQALAQGDSEAARSAFAEHAAAGSEQAPREAAAGQALANTLAQYGIEVEASDVGAGTDRAVLIDLVLALIAGLEQQVADLSEQSATLSADLEKREEALKRLRELTLGQPEA
jgi:hypothetical protein